MLLKTSGRRSRQVCTTKQRRTDPLALDQGDSAGTAASRDSDAQSGALEAHGEAKCQCTQVLACWARRRPLY
jgi:hypothetical protein